MTTKKAATASDVETPTRPKPQTKPAGGGAKPPRRPPAPPSSPARAKAKAKPKKATTAKPAAPEGQTKTDMILSMLRSAGGVTSKEIEAATGWKPHSVRGLLGTLRANGVNVVSKKNKGEATVYRIAKAPAAPAPEAIGDVV